MTSLSWPEAFLILGIIIVFRNRPIIVINRNTTEVKGCFAAINMDGDLTFLHEEELELYPSFKKEKKHKTMYQAVVITSGGKYVISNYLYDSQEDMDERLFGEEFRQLLTDRPIQIEVEE